MKNLKITPTKKDNIKIDNLDNNYITNKNKDDNYWEISIEDEKTAVKQVSQKLERMYFDLNEKIQELIF